MDSIESIMTKKVEWIKPSQTVFEATKIMKEKAIGPAIIKTKSIIRHNATIMPKTVIEPNVDIGSGSKVINSLIYEDTTIGSASRVENCIIGEGCKIGSSIKIGSGVIIGANSRIGDNVKILPDARIWPDIEVDSNSIIKGFLRRDTAN